MGRRRSPRQADASLVWIAALPREAVAVSLAVGHAVHAHRDRGVADVVLIGAVGVARAPPAEDTDPEGRVARSVVRALGVALADLADRAPQALTMAAPTTVKAAARQASCTRRIWSGTRIGV